MRTIQIANTKTQRRYTINSNATTLGELQDELTAQGIDFTGMTFTEGISKTQLLSRESPLPTNVVYRGQQTNNLVMLLTNTNKEIASGALSRLEVYAQIKEQGLQQLVKDTFGKNFTQVSTANLEAILNNVHMEMAESLPEDTTENTTATVGNTESETAEDKIECGVGGVDTDTDMSSESVVCARHKDIVIPIYSMMENFVKSGVLCLDDIVALSDMLKSLAEDIKAQAPQFSDSDIDDMIEDIMG